MATSEDIIKSWLAPNPITSRPDSGDNQLQDDTSGNQNGGGSYGGGGGGSGWTAPTGDEIADRLDAIVDWNLDTLKGHDDNANKVYDIANQMDQNLFDQQMKNARTTASAEWFPQIKKLQASAKNLYRATGNMGYSSSADDLNNLIRRVDDDIDVDVLTTLRTNAQTAMDQYFEALANNINLRNENAMKTHDSMRELIGDYAAQMNTLDNDRANALIDTEGRTINVPDWLNTGDWFADHVTEAATPEMQGLYRPDTAESGAQSEGLYNRNAGKNSAANQSYWNMRRNGYEGRQREWSRQ